MYDHTLIRLDRAGNPQRLRRPSTGRDRITLRHPTAGPTLKHAAHHWPDSGGEDMLGDFRKFIARGNVLDMAVGIIIGAAFTSVVRSLVDDIIMPPIGMAMGGVDFTSLFINLSGGEYVSLAEAQEAGAATINYGLFINALIAFLIVAFAVFMLVRSYTRMTERFAREAEAAPAAPTQKACPHCFMEVPVAATRCGHCTSDIGVAPA
jgi:large conductance mechanosensitive channel